MFRNGVHTQGQDEHSRMQDTVVAMTGHSNLFAGRSVFVTGCVLL